MKIFVEYQGCRRELSADDLQLISDALQIIAPDSKKAQQRADELALDFEILAELAEEVNCEK